VHLVSQEMKLNRARNETFWFEGYYNECIARLHESDDGKELYSMRIVNKESYLLKSVVSSSCTRVAAVKLKFFEPASVRIVKEGSVASFSCGKQRSMSRKYLLQIRNEKGYNTKRNFCFLLYRG